MSAEEEFETEENIQLEPKMVIASKYLLIELISGEPGPITVDNAQVWHAELKRKPVAIKFVSLELFIDDEEFYAALGYNKKGEFDIKRFKVDKINKLLGKLNLDYGNRLLVSEFEHSSVYREVGYSDIANACYLIMDYYPDGDLTKCKDKLISKTEALVNILEVIMKLHKLGFSFNNISPKHIMLKYDKKGEEAFFFVDFTRMSSFGQVFENVQKKGFASLNALEGGLIYPYDDIESFMYVVDYLMSGTYPSFESLEDEAEAKRSLESYNPGVAEAITLLRELRQQDEDVMNGEEYNPHELEEKINTIYSNYFPAIEELFESFNVVKSIQGTDLKQSEKRLLERIMIDMSTSEEFGAMTGTEEFNTYAIKIMNCVLFGCKYIEQEQQHIDSFLGFHEN